MAEAIEKGLFQVLSRQGRAEQDLATIRKAFEFAYKAHDGQLRKSEDPYIIHPVEVATILAELNSDKETICAGLLHDVLEDCNVSTESLEKEFGKSICQIVEGVTKLGKFSFSSKEERQAENFRKLLIAIAEDVRVVVVKLVDRLHNMRTLDYMTPAKQMEKAKETLEIYAPLANRFGLGKIKWELEDTSLQYLHPEDCKEIEQLVADTRTDREALIEQVTSKLRAELVSRGITAEIIGRPKHLYGIWKKIKRQGKSFEEIFDLLAVRVIIESNEDKNYCEMYADPDTQRCYEVMGIVHAVFKPIPGRFKDYIAMPKANSYQSLHTAVIGHKGRPIEIQIRTRRMHHVAEFGIAAHWRYKEAGDSVVADSTVDRKLAWLRQLVEWQKDLKDAQEYMDTVKMDLFADEVFVFSPRGDVIDLPTGATPIDFAYRIHTDVGHRCIGARINERIMPLSTVLHNGDIVEIMTSKTGHPRMDWINFAATHQAKNRIRQWFKKHHREEHIQQGRQMLEAEIGRANMDDLLKSDKLKEIGKKLNIVDPDDILAAIGYGDLSTAQIVNRMRDQEREEKSVQKQFAPVPQQPAKASNIASLAGLMHHIAKCCSPVPGEEILGIVTRGSGIAVHRIDCPNLSQVNAERRMAVDWAPSRDSSYPATIQVECIDRVGIAGDLLKKISDAKINLRDLRVETHKDLKTATVFVIVDVTDIQQLNRICSTMAQITDVLRVQRQDHRKKNNGKNGGNGKNGSNNVTPLSNHTDSDSRSKRLK